MSAQGSSAARAVVSDDGSTICLTAYSETGAAVPVALPPARAVALAGELIRAAIPKLGVTEDYPVTIAVQRRRGGDPHAERRQHRNENILALARLIGGRPSEQAEQIASRLVRYRPMLNETTPERRLMQKIRESGLPVGGRQIRKILAQQTEQKTCLEGHGSSRD